MKKLFLHIGFNKTGSTSIQKDMAANSANLKAQGILYPFRPSAPYMQGRQHVPLAAAVPGRRVRWLMKRKRKNLDHAFPALHAELAAQEFGTLVLSSESFGSQSMDAAKVAWLKEQFTGYDITVIAYIRRQDAYFLSAYQQRIKAGSTTRFDFRLHEIMPALRFDRRLALWREAFGAQKVIVRPFERRFWPEGELCFDFLETIDADRRGITPASPANDGLDYRAVELMRQLNLKNADTRKRDKSGFHQRRKTYLALAKSLEAYLPDGFEKQKLMLSAEEANMLRRHYRDSNEAALAGTGISADDFFPPVPESREARLPPNRLPQRMLLQLTAALAAAEPATPLDTK